ncbi:hypothetical protein DKX38_024688 [Salix brachista]|uniref:Uncharacterized protein n=1 Tax=Salix brachista TaxID=2182728 RepID=A0A5N5JMA6_9ROSI|nr:hypothetical protein DKX38_024688 [Salix brachista]
MSGHVHKQRTALYIIVAFMDGYHAKGSSFKGHPELRLVASQASSVLVSMQGTGGGDLISGKEAVVRGGLFGVEVKREERSLRLDEEKETAVVIYGEEEDEGAV